MADAKPRIVKIDPYHVDVHLESSAFVLVFFGKTAAGALTHVHLRCEFWWVKYIALALWKVIKYRRRRLAEDTAALTTEESNG